jgi:hypothetical protein
VNIWEPNKPEILIVGEGQIRTVEWKNSCSALLNQNWRITFLAMIRVHFASGEISAA